MPKAPGPTVFQTALLVKKGEMKLSEVRPGIRPRIARLCREHNEDTLLVYAHPAPEKHHSTQIAQRVRNARVA